MSLVMRSLANRDVAIPWEEGERKKKDQTAHVLGPYEMLLLLGIASRQRDEDENYPDKDCICIGSVATMCACTHLKPSTLRNAREFLQRSNLITYSEEGGSYPDIDNPARKRHYSCVYRLNKATLARYANTAPTLRDAEASDGETPPPREAPPSPRAAPPPPREVPPPPREAPPPPREAPPSPREDRVYKPEYKKEKEIKDSSRRSRIPDAAFPAAAISSSSSSFSASSSPSPAGPSQKAFGELDKLRANRCLDYIRKAAKLTEDELAQIDSRAVMRCVAGKDPKAVARAISNTLPTIENKRQSDFNFWIRLLISAIKKVPVTEEETSRDDIEQAFSEPVKVTAKRIPASEYAENLWPILLGRFHLGYLPEEKLAPVKANYDAVMADNLANVDEIFSVIVTDTYWDEEKKVQMTPEYFFSALLPEQILDFLNKALVGHLPRTPVPPIEIPCQDVLKRAT